MNEDSCGEPKQGLCMSLDGLTRASFQLNAIIGHRHLPIDNGNGREISEISLRSCIYTVLLEKWRRER